MADGGSTNRADNFAQTLLRVAWLAVLLGFTIQLLLLIAGYAFGTVPGIKPLIAEIVNRVVWSTIVCVGLAVGTLAAKAKPSAMALAGLLAAPLAFIVARSASKGVAQALDAGGATAGSSVFLFVIIKAIEYAWLGFLLGRLVSASMPARLPMAEQGSPPASFSAAL